MRLNEPTKNSIFIAKLLQDKKACLSCAAERQY